MEDNKKIVLEEVAGKTSSSEIKFLKGALKSPDDMEAIRAIGDKGSEGKWISRNYFEG